MLKQNYELSSESVCLPTAVWTTVAKDMNLFNLCLVTTLTWRPLAGLLNGVAYSWGSSDTCGVGWRTV